MAAEEPDAVAVVGMAGRFPGARSVPELWRNVLAGRESLSRFGAEELAAAGVDPAEYERPDYVPVRGVLDGVELFDAGLFGYSPREAELIDPQQRVLLECAWEALEHAGHLGGGAGRVGVFAGTSISTYLLRHVLGQTDPERAVGLLAAVLGNDKDHVATRIAYQLGLTGPALTVQTACSTSLVAVHVAVQSLRQGECDLALAGGAAIELPQRSGYVFERHGIGSPDGRCRAFDARAAGTVVGSGAALVLLRRAGEARRDGDTVHALIRGSAVNNDGADKVGYTAPSVSGQAEVVRAALRAAAVDPGSIGYVETHGTGTELGDAIEIAALTEAFRDWTDRTGYCGIGSIKPNVGHLDAAAGITGLVKAILALRHATLPPSINCEQPNPALGLASTPFYVVTEASPWTAEPGTARRCGVSSFGMGGTNAHVVLEEAPAAPEVPAEPPRPVLVVQSGRTPETVRTLGERLADHLDATPETALADAAHTLQVGRKALAWRRAVVAASRAELRGELARSPVRPAAKATTVAFLFPGQGTQFAGMAAGGRAEFGGFRAAVEECLDLLDPELRRQLAPLLCSVEPAPGAEDRLRSTRLAQPALFVVEYAAARLLTSWGIRPSVLVGHSIGEYAAACVAGALSLPDTLRLVVARGEAVARTRSGAMLAVLAGEETVRAELVDGLSVAAVNAPAAVVVAGQPAALDRLAARFADRGVRTRRLRVEHAFHSADVDPVLDDFRAVAATASYGRLRIPVLSGLTGEPMDRGGYTADYWARQLREPVRFGPALAWVLARPGPVLLEVGPGRSLTTLALQHPEAAAAVAAATLPAGETDPSAVRRSVLAAVGSAWSAGAALDWAAFGRDRPGRRVPLPTYPFARTRCWLDPPGRDAPGPPGGDAPGPAPAADEPATGAAGLEDRLAAIWRRLLGVGELGPGSDFFQLGGHSLLAVPLLSGMQAEFGVTLTLREAQEAPTLRGQAELLRARLRERVTDG